jgi:hypothetical protein
VNAVLSVSGELNGIITDERSGTAVIKAETYHDNAVPVELCFTVGSVYGKDCLAGNYLCEQSCTADEFTYTGKVSVSEEASGDSTGFGSRTSVGVSAPLTLRVRCNAHGRSYLPVFSVLLAISAATIAVVAYQRRRIPAIERDRLKLQRLQEKIKKEMEKHK